jgi:[ribosomal protein S18]-alanine N-acetyltransferase
VTPAPLGASRSGPVLLGVGDAPALSALVSGALGASWSEGSLRDELARPGAFALGVRDASEALLGAIVGWTIAGDLEINVVVVRDDARGRGLGGSLVSAALEHGRTASAERAFLELRASNEVARRVYLRAGFEISGRRRAYYQDGEDAITMWRTL